jgi:CheY-like chemotaxis protein
LSCEQTEILLVEDNPSDIALTLHAFKKANIANTIHIARDGVEALEMLFGDGGKTPIPLPKIILLDLKLPRVDGHAVLKRIKAEPTTQRIPVIVLTSSAEERDVMKTYESGANSYIIKPVDFEQFTEAVREIGRYWLEINHVG